MADRMPNPIERYAILKVHGEKCAWCGAPLQLSQLTIDHVIARDHKKKSPEALKAFLQEYGIEGDFSIDGFENWVPACSSCNPSKGNRLPRPVMALIRELERLRELGPQARKFAEDWADGRDKDKVIGTLAVDIESGVLSPAELRELLEVGLGGRNAFPHIPANWFIQGIDRRRGTITVSDGTKVGEMPISPVSGSQWLCSTCHEYGPWSGVLCYSCGHRQCD